MQVVSPIRRGFFSRIIFAPPVVTTPPAFFRIIGMVYLAATLVTTTVLMLDTEQPHVVTSVVYLLGVPAVGVFNLVFSRKLPLWCVHVMVSLGVLLLGAGGYLLVSDTMAVASVCFTTAISMATVFMGWRTSLAHLASASLAVIIFMSLRDIKMLPAAIVVSLVVWLLGLGWGVVTRIAGNSLRDGLTGLPNRISFEGYAERAMSGADPASSTALVLIDLDSLQSVNKVAGFHAGDDMLLQTAHGWKDCMPSDAVLARFGGDEFVVLLPDTTVVEAENYSRIAAENHSDVSTCCGITAIAHNEGLSQGLRRADQALAAAKRAGRGQTMTVPVASAASVQELEQAITCGEINVQFQPLVSLTDVREIVGVEALARWTTPTGRNIPPTQFVPLAEDRGLIQRLGHSVMRQAAEHVVGLRIESGLDVLLFVNTSGHELIQPDYAEQVGRILHQTGLPADRLVVEVTESTLDSETPAAMKTLKQLREQGVQIAIDDFGTGYSSLSRLHSMPVDFLKLDRAFISELTQDPGAPMLAVIAAMGSTLNVPIVAEGVEESEQADVLRKLGYSLAQGWLYSGAIRPDDLTEHIQSVAVSGQGVTQR